MKPTVQEEVEDDLAAEEENKLINEVRQRILFVFELILMVFMCHSLGV